MDYTTHFSTKHTPQNQPIPGKAQVQNSAGGFAFAVDKWAQLSRFLVLGAEAGSYYANEQKLSVENANGVVACIKENGVRAVDAIVDVSRRGKAPKNDPAIFALALACSFGDAATKLRAYDAITSVCRTGTHIFQFCQNIQNLRGWSRGLRRGVGAFYTDRDSDSLAYQLIKYRQRDGWTHRDVLRLAHPTPLDSHQRSLFSYAVGKDQHTESEIVTAFSLLQEYGDKNVPRSIELITAFRLPREAVPTALLKNVAVWEALLENMPMHALVRNLAKMTAVGLLKTNLDDSVQKVVNVLGDAERIRKSRLHPLSILNALKVYASGKGDKGSLTWSPVPAIVDALDTAFYLAFDNVDVSDKNFMLGLDVSGSMSGPNIAGMAISPREATAAMALVTARKSKHVLTAFSHQLVELKISPRDRLENLLRTFERIPFGGTDCSLPILTASQMNLPIDTFVVYTDNETWSGRIHPSQALKNYRQKSGRDAKLVVVGMVSNGFSIADPSDLGMLDVVGFSTDTPTIIQEFSEGRI